MGLSKTQPLANRRLVAVLGISPAQMGIQSFHRGYFVANAIVDDAKGNCIELKCEFIGLFAVGGFADGSVQGLRLKFGPLEEGNFSS